MIYHSIARCVKIGFKGFWWNDMKQIKKLIIIMIVIAAVILALTLEIVKASNSQCSDPNTTDPQKKCK